MQALLANKALNLKRFEKNRINKGINPLAIMTPVYPAEPIKTRKGLKNFEPKLHFNAGYAGKRTFKPK